MTALVVVTGPVASGKSTLAVPLAAALDLPLLAKDVVKEALFDSLGSGDPGWSKRLSVASFTVMFAVTRHYPRAVLEGNFRPDHAGALLALCARPVELHCRCPPSERALRYARRRRHPGHVDSLLPADEVTAQDGPGPLDLGGPVLEVDTTVPLDITAVAAWVRRHLSGG